MKSMEIKIRDHIRKNFQDSDVTEIKESIVASIESNDEVVLPGLGVFFEILWNGSDDPMKESIITTIQNHL